MSNEKKYLLRDEQDMLIPIKLCVDRKTKGRSKFIELTDPVDLETAFKAIMTNRFAVYEFSEKDGWWKVTCWMHGSSVKNPDWIFEAENQDKVMEAIVQKTRWEPFNGVQVYTREDWESLCQEQEEEEEEQKDNEHYKSHGLAKIMRDQLNKY